MTKLFRSLVLLILLSTAALAQNVWTPELQIRTRAVGSPAVSPDGKRVAYTISDPVMTADRSEYVTQIWIASSDGKENYQVTFGDKSSTNPRWSPDGTAIAFTSNRKDNRNNLYLLRLRGGEAEPLTDLKGSSVADFDWSPDGKWIAYTMTDAKTDDEEKADKARNDFRWVDENVKMARLYVLPVENDASGKREPRRLGIDGRHISAFDWSPDGSTIAVSHVASPVANYWPTADVSLIDVASGRAAPLAASEAAENDPIYSPDGRWILLSVSDVPARWARASRLALYPSKPTTAAAPKQLAVTFDSQPNVVGFSADGRWIYFTEAKGTNTALYALDVDTDTIAEAIPTHGVISALAMQKGGGVFAGVLQRADMPPELYAARLADRAPTKLSNANSDAARMAVGKTEVVKWKSKDGREIEGLLTYPVGYVAGKKVPLILNIHGGPAGVFNQTFIGGRGVYPLATFSQKGYAILRPNPRGSSGYGVEFRRANIKDWGGMDYQDLMTGVDHVIAMGVADPERLGVMGWSYGGYMTSWIITQTKRFKAASAGAPVTNLMSFNGTADIPSFVPDYFGGQSWEVPEVYAKHSAMFNIKGVYTPTLIIHGDADIRVPISQGYELYNALKAQNVPTRMLVLPRQPHGPTEPRMQLAAMQANLDWFEKYLGGK
ncbi:MAG: S9 family peptidase [Pyrinomonadaceae bacterium]